MTTDDHREEPAPPERVYLLLDDHGARLKQFRRNISGGKISIETISEAIELDEIKHDLVVLDGAIVDFHLDTPVGPGYTYLRYPCTDEQCPDLAVTATTSPEDIARAHAEHRWHAEIGIEPVDVTTGLGAMLYIKQHAADVALYGFCELSARHSLLFLCGAHMWLGASAINAEYPPEAIREVLLLETPEDELPIHKQLRAASTGFTKLFDSLDFLRRSRRPEALDWLGLYMRCGERSTLAEFKHLLKRQLGENTLESAIYQEIVCRWQGGLAGVLQAFDIDVSDWPDLRNVTSAKHWDEYNPVLTFLKDKNYQTFFTAADTRAALAYYRADQKRQAAEDPLGGY